MKAKPIIITLAAIFALLAAYAQSQPQPAADLPAKDAAAKDAAADPAQATALLWTYSGNYRMTPPPTLYSDSIRLKIQKVELLRGPEGAEITKVTYSPWYGKITAEWDKFQKAHDTPTISLLLAGDQTAKVKEGDILRSCFYPN